MKKYIDYNIFIIVPGNEKRKRRHFYGRYEKGTVEKTKVEPG